MNRPASKASHSLDIPGEMEDQSEISSYGSSFHIPPAVNRVLSNVTRGSDIQVHFPSAPEDVNLDKLFGFTKAQKMEGKFTPDVEDEPPLDPEVVPHRIFINHVDTFFARHFVTYLATQMYSFPRPEGEEESSAEEKSSPDETDVEEDISEEEGEEGEENQLSSQELLENPMKLPDDDTYEDEEKEVYGDYDEDPFACLLEEESEDSDHELELVEKLFAVDRSDVDLHQILPNGNTGHVGSFDLRKLKPEEYFELLDITSEEARVRYLRSITHKKQRRIQRKRAEKEEQHRLREAQRKIKYSKKHKPFEIYGTLRRSYTPNELEDESLKYFQHVHIIDDLTADREAYLDLLMTCGTVVFTLVPCQIQDAEQAKWTVQAMTRRLQDKELKDREAFRKSLAMRTFILISPLMTWANSLHLELDTSSDLTEMAFIESDFRRRNPHDNFIKIYRAENEVLNCGQKYRKRFKTLIISAGVSYGYEERVLDFLFVHTWKCETDTPMFNTGENLIPLIHVSTLAEIVYKCIRKAPFIKPPLIFAMERKCLTLQEIAQTVSAMFGNGNVMKMKKDSQLILPEPAIDQVAYDYLTTNLKVTPKYLVDTLDPKFVDNFIENRKMVEQQYIESNRLYPLRIFIDGPPLSGKTTLAVKLCQHYNIHYLNNETMVLLYRELLSAQERDLRAKQREKMMEDAQNEVDQNEEDTESQEFEDLKNIQSKLADLKRNLYDANGHITDEAILMNILAELLTFKRVTNIGYLLDGWPSTYDQLKEAFAGKDEFAPYLFIKIDLDKKRCLERIYNVSEDYLMLHPVDEITLIDRMFSYQNLNQDENLNVTTFFKEKENAKIIEVNANEEINFFRLCFNIGKPRDRKFWISIIGIDSPGDKDEQDNSQVTLESEDEADSRKKKLNAFAEEQIKRLTQEKENEKKILAVYAERLRKYAQRYLMPTLCRGLLETSRTEPPNPIDFLAEYLFRNNPAGKLMTELQRRKFGIDHITVSDDESFRLLQENLAKKQLNKTTKLSHPNK